MSELMNKEENALPNKNEQNEAAALHVPHVYVPSFTGASDHYRMASATVENKEPEVKVVEKTAREETASFESAADDFENASSKYASQIVHVQVTVEEETSSNIFQAAKPAAEEITPPDRTVDDEKQDIHKLISPNAAEEKSEPLSQDTEKENKTDLSRYVLPDPVMAPPEKKEASLEFVPMTVPAKRINRTMEYVTPEDTTRYKNRFLDSLLSIRVRLLTVIALSALFMMGAVSSVFGADLVTLLGIAEYSFWLPLLDLQGCICLLLLALPETLTKCREAIAKKFVFSMLYPLLFLFTAGLDLVSAIRWEVEYPLFSAFFGVATAVLLLDNYWDTKAAFSAFRTAASEEVKTVVEKVKTAALDKETLALDGAIDEYRSATAVFHKTHFVSDFRKQTHTPVGHGTKTLISLCIAGGLIFVTGLIALVLGNSRVLSMLETITLSLYFLPFASFFIFSLPFFMASKRAEEQKSAILGTAGALSYADIDVISFADTEVFDRDDIKIQHVRLFGEAAYNEVFRDMTALFSTVGGTLYQLFSEALDGSVYPALLPLVEKNGISGKVDGVTVLAGSAAYLRKNGVELPPEREDKVALTNRVMYSAKNGIVTAEFLISYSMSEQFSMLLPHLRKARVIPLIYSHDPNLDNELFTALMREEGAIRVMKDTIPEKKEEVLPNFCGGLFTLGNKSSAVMTILTAKKLKRFFDLSGKITGYLFLAAPPAALTLTLCGVSCAALTVVLAAWQAIGLGVFAFFTKQKFGKHDLK